MTKIAKKAVSVFVSFTTVMMLSAAIAPSAQADAVSDLMAQIAALQAQIAKLSGQTSTGTGYTFTTNLQVGSRGEAVRQLQMMLNADPDTMVAATGAGSAGMESDYFGVLTKAAVAKFQTKHGISPTSGFVGPLTRAALNSMGVPANNGGNNGGNTGSGSLQGGAGDITVTSRSSSVEDQVLEGDDNTKVFGFDVKADGSDVAITSVHVELEHTDTDGSDHLDRYADEVSIMQDGKVVGSANVDDFDESSNVYTKNISVSNAVVKDGEKGHFYVAITAVNNVDSDDLGTDWDVSLGQIRFKDATGAILTNTDGDDLDAQTFTYEDLSTAGDVELQINEEDTSVNNAHTEMVDDTSDTNDVEVLSFSLKAKGSDISLQDMTFDVTSSGAGVTEIANDFRLMKGSDEVGTLSLDNNQDDTGGDSYASSTDAAVALIFNDIDDDDVTIDDGDTAKFTLVADINDIDGAFTGGDSLSVSLANADVTAEDENGDDVDVTGSASSDTISFQSTGLSAAKPSSSAVQVLNLSDDSTDDQGKFEMTFDVTAFEDTAWVSLTAASSTSANTDDVGVAYGIENASTGASVLTGTNTAILERVSGGTLDGNYVKINAGQTARLKLTVYHDAAATGIYRVQMDSIGFNQSSAAAPNDEYNVLPASDFESASVQVLN